MPVRSFIVLALAVVVTMLPVGRAAANNLVTNGDFSARDASGFASGWKWGDPSFCRLAQEAGNTFLRCDLREKGVAIVTQSVKLPTRTSRIELSLRMRAKGLVPGAEAFMTGRVQYLFHNAAGEHVGGWNDLRLSGDGDWAVLKALKEVPEDAVEVTLDLGMWAASGTVDFDDVVVRSIESAASLAMKVDPKKPDALENPGFADIDVETGLPKGWEIVGDSSGVTVRREGEAAVARFESSSPGGVALRQRVPLHPWWARLDIAAESRAESLELTPDGFWRQGATLLYRFYGVDGKLIGEGHFGNRSAADWGRGQHPAIEVPSGAVELEATVGLVDAKGVAEFRGVTFRPHVAETKPGEVPREVAAAWKGTPVETLSRTRAQMSLSGPWQFMPGRETATKEPTDDWGTASVPGSWHDAVTAKGLSEPWIGFNPRSTNKAWYQRVVTPPADWDGRGAELYFDRVSTDAKVWVNGQEVGEVNWPGGSVDVSGALKPGSENTIRVMVLATDNKTEVVHYMGYVNEPKAKAELSTRGLISDVVLRSHPAGTYVRDVLVRPSVREKKLFVDLELRGASQGGAVQVTAEALDESGKVEKSWQTQATLAGAADEKVTLGLDWENPRLWDVGKPDMYTLVLNVSGVGIADEYKQTFGFREFWIDGRKFFLNGTEIRLRPQNLQYGASAEDYLKRGYNYAEIWPYDRTRRGSGPGDDDKWIAEAARAGLPIGANAPHMADVTGTDGFTPENVAAWRRYMEHELRRWRNEPCIVMWAHTANALQWQGDSDPWLLGMTGFSSVQEYSDRVARARELIGYIKALDPSRPVYAHHGSEAGDVYTSNMYLNFIPLQEREEWMSHWSEHAKLPFMAVEFGPPLYASVMRGRDGYTHQGHSEPLPTEWAAAYLGSKAYAMETPEFRQLLHERFKGGDPQKEYDPHIRHDGKDKLLVEATGFKAVLDLFITNSWRSWRTMGVTGGMIPWHHDHEPALRRVNGPTLAWIAGAGGVPDRDGKTDDRAFTSKTHHYAAGAAIEKQVALINDTRESAEYTGTWRVELDGRELASESFKGSLGVSQTLMLPIRVDLPAVATGARSHGAVVLRATIAGESHEDRFTFDVFGAPEKKVRGTLSVFDSKGDTSRYLESLGYTIRPWTAGAPADAVAVIGRAALSSGGRAPDGVEAWVRDGGRLVVFAQDPSWTTNALHLRTAPVVTRRVFAIDEKHPALAGLDEANLRDWNGDGTLVEAYPHYPGYEWTPSYGWHWGNRGSVTSAAIEKPHRSSWRPLLECEFDAAYTPLMEMDYGHGRVTFCTLDVEARTAADPAADRLALGVLDHVATVALPGKAANVTYLGNDAGAGTLATLGVIHTRERALDASAGLVVIGPDAQVEDAALRSYLQRGGKALVLRRTADPLPLGVKLKKVEGFYGSTDVPGFPEAAGLSASDLRWRSTADAWILEGTQGLQVGAGGQVGRIKVGKGVVVFAQLGPEAVPANEKRFFRFTRWRQTRALSQLLANLGASFEQDKQFFDLLASPDHYVNLAGTWQAQVTLGLAESPKRQWHAPRPMTDDARRLVQPDASGGEWQQVSVPAYMESYGPAWRWIDGEVVFRKVIDWPEHTAGKEAFISVGRVDETETTFVNGSEIGSSRSWLLSRGHRIPAGVLKAGENTIALRTWDEGIHGGVCGSPNQIYIRVAGDDPGFYHPDYVTDDVSEGQEEKDWSAWAKQWTVADNPYRYYRW